MIKASLRVCLPESLFNQQRTLTKLKKDQHSADLSFAWRRPTLTGGNPQLPSALKSLTSVFGMGTGVTSSLSPPNIYRNVVPSKLDNTEGIYFVL